MKSEFKRINDEFARLLKEDDAFRTALEDMHNAYVDGLREASKVPSDWTYHCMWTTESAWNELLDLIEDQMMVPVISMKEKNGENLIHFTAFISPEGMNTLREYVAVKKLDEAKHDVA